MPTSCETALQQRCQQIVTSPVLSPAQKRHFLALEAENALLYPTLPEEARRALDEGVICDMFEGHAPFKPRYVLPDYARFLANGSQWLELEGAKDLDDALSLLTILYHHVPSVTSMPVYLGQLDTLLQPYVRILTQDAIDIRIKRFWRYLDRTLPDAFMHANIGPADTPITRAILRADAELKQVAPNLTFIYDPDITPDTLLLEVAKNICECSKPHISNGPVNDKIFTKGQYGVVSCYNSLPLAGGGSTLVRLNLKAVAERSTSVDDFFSRTLPHYCQQQIAIINSRCEFLYEKSHFFENSFLVREKLIDPARFAPMFGMYGLAEAVNLLCDKAGLNIHYGKNKTANDVGYRISAQLADFVENTPVKYGWNQRALLHAQSGISSDIGTTPGARLPYGDEPDPITHLRAVAPHHAFYHAGISDILTLDETIKRNPQALAQLCLGAFKAGMREFTANVSGNSLVRVTGYMVRLSDLEKYRAEGSRMNTTWLGEEAARNTHILERQARVISHEQQMRFSQ
ncbi:MAG TPA: YjjI family glycine radical enzyme [Salmonella bongori]|uniref:YjjI family glycine radical enzyme n=3 Tax=Salmonella bongori TaxID=54736 RepID=A0A0K0HHB8_SALBC|nr:YjjI family glycine radical enzyme [Salmonella bongori]ASG56104.1 glycine radical enzyme, YjjI family [Salmonella bongori serovar 66:z41:- str. SA19983605]ECC9750874.1 YjjI family glycine radical enzyme [Salmonella bongori]EDP8560929.1 YjjI family glycine radical enzyme [Salmonella bongori]EDP8604793.1 YjjI family glycine radical enzyme [Salmonella bongori]EDP8626434.1 YjjI family glycine radical enzyme [Salmonella bongori]